MYSMPFFDIYIYFLKQFRYQKHVTVDIAFLREVCLFSGGMYFHRLFLEYQNATSLIIRRCLCKPIEDRHYSLQLFSTQLQSDIHFKIQTSLISTTYFVQLLNNLGELRLIMTLHGTWSYPLSMALRTMNVSGNKSKCFIHWPW